VKQSATLDSSFWINCDRSGLLPYMLARYRLTYPPAVARELSERFASGREFWRLVRTNELVEVAFRQDRVRLFGPGEREAINVALEHPEWLLFLDDRRPFDEASRLGLRVVCTPALVIKLYHEGAFGAEDAAIFVARLAALGRINQLLLDAAMAALERSVKEETRHAE
jgi:predicted nucleic acid-binding protein